MPKTSITAHDPQVVLRHQIACAECAGSEAGGGQRPHEGSCCRCGGKGWVGNCASCRGLSILESANGYAVCPTCRGHGHLYQEFYCEDPIHAALIVRLRDAGRFFVPLGEAPVAFGRFPPPYTSVRLYDVMMTKQHFEIVSSTSTTPHEVYDYGRYSLMINGRFLAGVADRVRRDGEEPSRGDRCPLTFGDVLEIGQYSMEYVALRDRNGWAGS